MHNDFTVFLRVVPSGRKVAYYYAYDENGERRGPWSTGQLTKTAAKNFCNRLIRDGRLIPGRSVMPTFEEYSQGWWEWDSCPYLKDRRKRHNITPTYADNNKKQMTNQLLPYFGKMKLGKINQEEIELWFDFMAEKGYKNTYTNGVFGTLKTMMIWAVRKKLIPSDPTQDVERLVNDRKTIKIITPDEFRALFASGWRRVWDKNRIACAANKLAALTGMRCSEILGLRGEYVFDTHIYLCAQYDKYGYRDTKTKDKHNIPLTPQMIADLRDLAVMNGKGYLFSLDGGGTPVSRKFVYNELIRAFQKIGMSRNEIKERGLCFHAWRHFCNTELQKAGLSVQKVQAVTGHKSARMTEWYCHFNPAEFEEVPKVQEKLLQGAPPKAKTGKDNCRPAGPRPVQNKKTAERKRA